MSAAKRVPLGLALINLIAVVLTSSQPAFAELKSTQKAKNMNGVSQAALAARLAFEGEKRQSPVLLLAAAELLGDLTQAPPPPSIKVALGQAGATGGAANSSNTSPFDPHALVEKARALVKQDPQLAALVNQRAEQLGKRGIPSSVIGDRPTIDVQGTTFVLLGDGMVSPDTLGRIENVPFVGAEPAIVLAVSEAPNALRMGVFDQASGFSVAEVELIDPTILAAAWAPEKTSPHAIVVQNRTTAPTRVMVLANVSDGDGSGGGGGGGGGGVPTPPAPFSR